MTETEMAVIGCLVLNDRERGQMVQEVAGADFTAPELAQAWDELAGLYRRYHRLDPPLWASSPNREIIIRCAEGAFSFTGWRAYVQQMKEETLVARAQVIGMRLGASGNDGSEVRAAAEQLNRLLQGRSEVRSMTASEGAVWFMTDQKKPVSYMSTGFSRMDKYAKIKPGDYVIVGARPSTGKTALSLQLARQMAERGKKVVFYSYETSIEGLQRRLGANTMAVSFEDVMNHRLDIDRLPVDKLDRLDRYAALPFTMVEFSGRSVAELRTDAVERGADVVFIDYIGLIPGGRKDSAYEAATKNSKALHEFAQQTKITVVGLSQMNRDAQGEPKMEQLRDSGQVEQDADIILLLYNDEEAGAFYVIVAKNKEGRVGRLPFAFIKEKQLFMEVENHV